jgi:hypothetical protein
LGRGKTSSRHFKPRFFGHWVKTQAATIRCSSSISVSWINENAATTLPIIPRKWRRLFEQRIRVVWNLVKNTSLFVFSMCSSEVDQWSPWFLLSGEFPEAFSLVRPGRRLSLSFSQRKNILAFLPKSSLRES